MNFRSKCRLIREKWSRSYRKRRLEFAQWLLKPSWMQTDALVPPANIQIALDVGVVLQPIMAPFDTETSLKPGVCIVGYLRSEIGLGQAARCLAYAADAARLPSSFHHLRLQDRENEPEFATKCIPVPDRRANLLVFGLPSITALQSEIRGGRHNILYPFWELQGVDPKWLDIANHCAEVWAPSSFVANTFRERSKRPVTLVPQPVQFPTRATLVQKQAGPLTFLSYFDYDSFGERKNPKATVQSFRAAFPLGTEDVKLIVKTRGFDDRGLRNWLAKQSDIERRIEIIDRTVDRSEMERLLADCDAFVTLHRSEGFGFGAAEALAARKVVIATDFSGTTDFIDNSTGFPVAFKLIPVGAGQYPCAEGNVWADADIEHAATAMQSIYDQPGSARNRAELGYQRLRAGFSPEAIGDKMRTLLAERGLL